MKISIAWLNEYLDRPAGADEAEPAWTRIGFPIDGRETPDDDTVLEVEVTSNRPDCLSHIGLARELAAATGRKLKKPAALSAPPADRVSTLGGFTLDNQTPDACPLYTARIIRGVKIAPSPPWLQKRLLAIGLRPVNNVVDVTNFVLHETGHPLHAFDLARLQGGKIVIRPARADEAFQAIDQSQHKLKAGMLVIADATKPVALAGVMGGLESEVTPATTDLLIEAACFDPLAIRPTSRVLKLDSDSSYRFERGVPPAGVEAAGLRACQLICELAGGRLEPGILRSGEVPAATQVTLRPEACSRLLGIEVPIEKIKTLLQALELNPTGGPERIVCTPPGFRTDLQREVDLIEEIARLHGLEHLPIESQMKIVARPPQLSVEARRRVQRVLLAHGFHETINFSFLAPEEARLFAEGRELIRVHEEKKKATPFLRPSLLPSLLACRKLNQDAGNRQVRLFERASTYWIENRQYVEQRRLSLLTDVDDLHLSLRNLRGVVEELLTELGRAPGTVEIIPCDPPPSWARLAAEIRDPGGTRIGLYGMVSDAVQKKFDLQTSVLAAEFDDAALTAAFPPRAKLRELAAFPSIERDLSLVVDDRVAWSSLEQQVRAVAPRHLEKLDFVTTYRGKPIERGRKSVTLRLVFRDAQRTLRHDEVNEQVEAVIRRLKSELKAELRDS